MKADLNLASIETDDLNITLQALKVRGGLILIMIMVMMMMIILAMMMMVMRIETICDVINKRRTKVKVVIIM